MKQTLYPTVIQDNFFTNPDEMVGFLNSQNYFDPDVNYPGKRTNCLSTIDYDLYNSIVLKVLVTFNPELKLPTDKNVTVTAITIPIIPNKFPCLEVSGEDKPLKAKINNTPDTKYKIADRFADINYLSFFFFLYIANILWVTKNPPKILTAAKIIAKNP